MTGAKSVSGEIYHQIEGDEFNFHKSGKGRVKVDDLIGDASSLPSFIHQDDIIIISETDYIKVLQLSRGDIDEEEASARESTRETGESTLEAQSDDSATDDDNTDEHYQLNMAAGTRTRNRRMPRRLADFIA